MDNWLNRLPKPILVIGALALGTLFIVFSDPPHTICDTQIENFKTSQKGFLFSQGEGLRKKTARLQIFREICLKTNTVGGCLEYFHGLRKVLLEVDNVYRECRRELFDVSQVRENLWKGAEILVRVGWGETPPEDFSDKYGWLEAYDMNLYCKIRDQLVFNTGKEKWKNFKIKMLTELPGAKEMPRSEILQRSILSENCRRFR